VGQELYKLPKGWAWFSVKNLSSKVQYGHTTKAREKGNAQFLRITDIQNGQIQWDGVPFVDVSDEELEKYRLHVDDLVFARSGATSGKSILIISPPSNSIFASYLIRVVPDINVVFPKFLELFFQSPIYWKQVGSNVSGAAQPNINGTKLSKFQVSLPPLNEQKRIVAKLDALFTRIDTAITHLQQTLELSKVLFASALDEKIDYLTKNAPLRQFGDVVVNHDGRRVPIKASERKTTHGTYPYYGATGIIDYVDDYIFDGERLLISEDGANLVARKYPIAFRATGKYWVNNHAHIVNAIPDITSNQFLEVFFAWTDLTRFITGSAQPKLNQKKLNSIVFPVPSLDEQKRIVAHLDALSERIRILDVATQEKINDLTTLKASLLDAAFKGEL